MTAIAFTAKNISPLPGVQPFRMQAGGALTVGHAVYVASDADVEGADADALASSITIGLVVSSSNGGATAAAGDMVDVAGPGCRVTGFTGLTPGALVYIGTTPGVLDTAAPAGSSSDFVHVLGVALSATDILVNPYTYDITAQ